MKRFHLAAGVFTILAVLSCLSAHANYQFDDVHGPSGVSYQWVVLNNASNTFGDSHATAINVSGDLLTGDQAELDVLNGKSEGEAIQDRSLSTLFVLAVDGHSEFDMNFRSPSMQFDVATPNIQQMTTTTESGTAYVAMKTANGKPEGDYDDLWRNYHFVLERNLNTGEYYNSVAHYFYFQQNPNTAPSQGTPRPLVVANVSPYSAVEEPLRLRMTLRDSTNSSGNITAYNYDTWYMDNEKTIGGGQWVFVPVNNLDTDNERLNYYLTTEVANYSSYRYAAFDGQTNSAEDPDCWKFDLPRIQGATDIEREFDLDPASNIAPGLVTVYKRTYNVNEENKRPLRLHPVDDPYTSGYYDLRLNHRIIRGKRLGETYKYPASEGRFNLFEITAYQPSPNNSMTFYSEIARVTGSNKEVVPSTSNFTSGSVTRTRPADEAIQYFTVNHTIPGALNTSSREGIMPLHITINIPVTQINDREWWNSMLDEWRRSGNIAEMFDEKFNIFLLTETDDKPNPWNLSQELQKKGIYADQIKVFMDEERGRITNDNDRGLITISFIVMLMNGTRDGVRPELSIVSDNSVSQEKDYIVIRDGSNDNKWTMTFFVAPSGFVVNPGTNNNSGGSNNDSDSSGGGGGGGCNALNFAVIALIPLMMMKYERRK